MKNIKYYFTGTSLFTVAAFGFNLLLAVGGVKPLFDSCSFIVLLTISFFLIGFAWWKTGIDQIKKEERDNKDNERHKEIQTSLEKLSKNESSRQKHEETYILFDADKIELLKSHNISSITDNGINDITFNFVNVLPENYRINLSCTKGSIPFEVKENLHNSARIIFPDGLTGIVKISFEI